MFDEKFWLAIAFFSFLFLIIRHVVPMINKQLEAKSQQIAKELLEAKEMKEKAAKVLQMAEERHQEAIVFSKKVIEDSAIEAKKYLDEALKSAEQEIAKKMAAVESRIKQEQEMAVREIKAKMIDSTLRVVVNNLQNMPKNQADNLVKKSINDISKLVH